MSLVDRLLQQPARHQVGHERVDVGADRVGRDIRRLGDALGDRLPFARARLIQISAAMPSSTTIGPAGRRAA